MLVDFFFGLRRYHVPVAINEYLTLLEALDRRVAMLSVDDFYYLARAALVKDERHFDRFDQCFGTYFKGMEELFDALHGAIPEEWLRRQAELELSEEDKALIEAMGGFEKLMEELKKRLEEQKGRHQGGNKWIGTAGKSPFGAYGYNPEGVRIGQHESRHRRAVKVWDRREFKNFDDTVELGTRNMKVALRKLRRFAREGAEEELDLDDTVRSTARNGGLLDIKMVPERHNAVKVLLFLDVGGSMDDHVRVCEELFSAARGEFKHLEYFYFHNFVYETVWKDNRRASLGADPDDGRPPQVQRRAQGDLRRRREHEPLRDRLSRGERRALERGGGVGLDGARAGRVALRDLAQPEAGEPVGLHPVDRDDPRDHGEPHVPPHRSRGSRRGCGSSATAARTDPPPSRGRAHFLCRRQSACIVMTQSYQAESG